MYHLTTFLSEMMTHFAVPFLRTDVYILRGYGSSLIYLLSVKLSMHYPPLQISATSAASTLSDRSRFKKYFRTDPTFEIFAPAVLSLLEHYNWSRIVFLTQNENLFNNVSEAKGTGVAIEINTDACSHTVHLPGLNGSNCFSCMQTLPSAFMNDQYRYYYIKYKTLGNSIFKNECCSLLIHTLRTIVTGITHDCMQLDIAMCFCWCN